MSTFPSIISTISSPTATDKLSSPSHSSIESAQNDAISKLETFVGTLSSTTGTLMYDVRAAASDGGGHVQKANKGGTGQTAYTKGDILVAQSSSVLSKLAVGSDNQALVADSGQQSGVKWTGVANAEAIQNQQYTYARASVMSGSVYGVKLSDNPSILSDGLGLVVKFPAAPTSSAIALQVFTSSSGSVAARIKKTDLSDPDTINISASMIGVLEFDSVSSVFQLINPASQVFASKNGIDVKNMEDVSSVQTIAHGLGKTPTFVEISSGETAAGMWGHGSYDGSKNVNIWWDSSNAPLISSTFGVKVGSGTSAYHTGVITVDATNLVITWTKTGSPTGVSTFIWRVSG